MVHVNIAPLASVRQLQRNRTNRWRKENPDAWKRIQARSYGKHRTKRLAEMKARNAVHPERVAEERARYWTTGRAARLKRLYGLTPSDVDALHLAQRGCCAACGRASARLDVDHCHRTGKVRGLLCGPCNRAAGLLGESPEAALGLAKYLRASLDVLEPQSST